jgi:hypothetical protein
MSELTYHPDLPAEPERPRTVTVIGWIWLVLASFSLFKTAVNFILLQALQPAIPSLLALAPQEDPSTRFLHPLLEHYGLVLALQALLAAAVGISAYYLLRLRPWARVAIQAVCWLGIVYLACFAVFWIFVMSRTVAARAHRPVPTSVGILIPVVLAAGLAVMIGLLRSRRVRESFVASPLSPLAR